jgi:hypothetical protein
LATTAPPTLGTHSVMRAIALLFFWHAADACATAYNDLYVCLATLVQVDDCVLGNALISSPTSMPRQRHTEEPTSCPPPTLITFLHLLPHNILYCKNASYMRRAVPPSTESDPPHVFTLHSRRLLLTCPSSSTTAIQVFFPSPHSHALR